MAHNKIVLAPTGEVLIDLSQDTATEADVVKGKTFHKADGEMAEGAYEPTVIEPETEAVTVELSMAEGDQVIEASEDKLLSKVTVTKPSTMLPENIKEGVEIGGVVGTHVGGGSGENKLASAIDGTITELTAADFAGITKIRQYAFYYVSSLVNVQIPDNITLIDARAFAYCLNIENLILPKSLTKIMEYTFQYCTKLQSVDVPSNVTELGSYAFANCSNLASVTLHEGLLRIDGYAFSTTKIGSITIPNSVTEVNASAFYSCASLANVNLPNGLKNIWESTFYNCSSLNNITLPDSLTSIESGAFRGCSKLGSIALPNGVTALKSRAFYGCTALEYIDLTAYGTDRTFPTLANTDAFTNAGKNTTAGTFEIRVPSGRKAVLAAMTNWSTYADNIVEVGATPEEPEEPDLTPTEGLEYELITSSTDTPSQYYGIKSMGTVTDTDIVIPSQVDGIPVLRMESSAFKGNKSITSVIFPAEWKQIPDSSFSGCSALSYVKLPTNLGEGYRRLGYQVFYGCTNLKEIAIPGNFTEIGYTPFSHLEILDLTAYGESNPFPSLYNTASLPSATIKEIRVPKNRKAGLSGATNWSAFADKIVEVS